MSWTNYRKRKNAFKLHLSFELNRLIPTEFLLGSGNSSERTFLDIVLEAGVTYIADRGYASFEIIAKVLEGEAYFIFRVKDNLLSEVREKLAISVSELPRSFRELRDELIIFKSDKQQNVVRMIQFEVARSKFRIITRSARFINLAGHHLIRLPVADRVVFQVFEAHLERVAFVESQSKRSRDTVLSVNDAGTLVVEIEAELSKKAREKKSGWSRKKREKGRKSGGMD